MVSDETRRKISEAKRGKPNPGGGSVKGRKLSEATRIKMSLAHQGKAKSESHRKAIGEANKGYKKTLGKKQTEYHAIVAGTKIALANVGKKATEETKKKMSAAQKGVPKSADQVSKLRDYYEQLRATKEALRKAELKKWMNIRFDYEDRRHEVNMAVLGKKAERKDDLIELAMKRVEREGTRNELLKDKEQIRSEARTKRKIARLQENLTIARLASAETLCELIELEIKSIST